ncbi:MAG: GerAB/ArcD/ProY family transporter [Ignavibacteriales bacterium]
MLENGKIDAKQATLLMISMVLPTAILLVPAIVVKHARQDGWISLVLATLIGLLIARLVASLSIRFPNKTLFEYAEEILGRAPGKIVGLLYIWWLLHTNALIIAEFASLPCIILMPETPFAVFFILGIAVSGYAVRNGLEVLSRYNQLIAPISLGLVVLIFILVTREMKVQRLLPVLDNGLLPIVKGAATPASWLGEIVILSMIIPYLTEPKEAHKVAFLSVLLVGIFMTLTIVGTLLVFGPNVTAAWVFPVLNAVRAVLIANFLERLESVVVSAWVFTGIAKIGVFYYAAVLGSAQWLGLKDYRPLVAPTGVILLGMAFLCSNIVDLLDFAARAFPPYALIVFEAGIPLILLALALIRGRGESS